MNIAFYISGHGLGHSVRSIEVILSLCKLRPDAGVIVSTWAPEWIFRDTLPGVPLHRSKTDVGLVQVDNLRFDLGGTLRELEAIHSREGVLVEREVEFLREMGAHGIVCDVPFIPFAAAERLKIPSVILTNFTWDWIYSLYEGFEDVSAWIKSFYMKAALTLRLPFHGGMGGFPNLVDLPLVARRCALTKPEARKSAGLDDKKPAFLVSFTELELGQSAVDRLAGLKDYMFIYKEPFRIEAPNFTAAAGDFTAMVRAVDGVITKPGYGIVAECIANETPMLYTDRGRFAEYPRLVEGIERFLKQAHIPSGELYQGNWAPYLEALLGASGPPERIRADGAEAAAEAIVELMEG